MSLHVMGVKARKEAFDDLNHLCRDEPTGDKRTQLYALAEEVCKVLEDPLGEVDDVGDDPGEFANGPKIEAHRAKLKACS